MGKDRRCSVCHGDMGFMYMMTRTGYQCIPCHTAITTVNKLLISQMPDIEEMPPFDGKYRTGILATSETMAKTFADQYYDRTPGMGDMEH